MYYETVHDVDDGFEGETGACREYTLHREDPDLENLLHGSVDTPKLVQSFSSQNYKAS